MILFVTHVAFSQTPVITNISTKNLYPKGTIIITGSGFSTNPADLIVWFGHVEGTIKTSTEFTIEVEVPAGANYSNIEVIRKSSRRIGRSAPKFMSSFYGEPFDASRFSSVKSQASLSELRDLCSCDLNLDGKTDIMATRFSAATRMLILQNGTLSPGNIDWKYAIEYNLNFSSDHVTCGDVDGDGFPDIVVTKGGSSNRNSVFVIRNTTATKGADITLNSVPFILSLDVNHVAIRSAIQDLNRDGRPELVVTNTADNSLYIYVNDPTKPLGANPFLTTPIKILVTGLTNTYGLDVQDFDGDGLPDILVNPVSSADHYVLRNISNGSITFAAPQRIPLGGELRNVVSADLNKDGKLDLITTSTNTNRAFVLYNLSTPGTILFNASPIQLTTDNAPWGITVSDIDGDTDPDILIAHQLSATISTFINDGGTTPVFTKFTIPTPRASRNIISGDVDGDGKPDLGIASFVIGTYAVDILRNGICHKPKILNQPPLFVCNNPVELQTIPALNVTFTWREGANTIKNSADPFASVTTGGSYTVSATTISPSAECANIVSESITVTGSAGSVPANPVLSVTNATLCAGATLNMSVAATTGASYVWTGPNWTETTTSPTVARTNATSAYAGEYTVQVAVGNCKSNVSAGVLVNIVAVDNFTISSNSSTNSSCEPNAVKLTVNNVSGFSYAWRKNAEAYPAPTVINTFDAIADGQYYVQVSNSALGCPPREFGPVSVSILKAPVADFTIGSPRCANAPIQFTNISTVDADAEAASAPAPVQYKWSFDDGKTSSDKNATNTYVNAGPTYNVSLTVSYLGVLGCTNTKTIPLTITNTTLPVITASPATICPGQTTTLNVTPAYSSVTWTHGPSGQTITVNEPGTYTANATDAGGCTVPKSITVASDLVPQLVVSAQNTTIPSGQSTQLTASGAHTFSWTPAESLSATEVPDPIASPTTSTTYTVTGSFTNGCSTTAQITIVVDGSLINLTIPVAFSPNSDMSNDFLIIQGVEEYPDCTLNIFDARGKRIYQRKGYNNDWDGTYEGKPVPGGTYYYVFSCPGATPLTGSVLVFR